MLAPLQPQANSSEAMATKTINMDEKFDTENSQDFSNSNVEWYQPMIKTLPPSTVSFFEDYVGIKREEAIKRHIYNVRNIAWKV